MFVPMLFPPDGPSGSRLVISVRGAEVALGEADGHFEATISQAIFIGTLGGSPCWAVDADRPMEAECAGPELDAGGAFADLRRLFGQVDEPTWLAAARALQLVEWARTHRYCGRCGAPTEPSPVELARRCPRCGLLAFPRLAPAVIVLVERDDGRALLARNSQWRGGMYSCLAGFVEPGESVEGALRREVREEVSVEVDDLRYRRSQPWPFPHSLMLGFNARYASGEVVCDGTEIVDAGWFAPDNLPELPGPISIARWLIDDWVARRG
ncbi:MAG: NAD(+) diphosphatase [Acidimicrobiales bacterium]|nr:NAD(+) diphosphatase [Acidimicrobiales bacterium]